MNHIERAKRGLAVSLIAAIALLPATAALATGYTSTLNYTVRVEGANRDFFSATNLSISGTYRQSHSGVSTAHTVELWRNRFGPDDFIGRTNRSSQLDSYPDWSNVGPGTYRFVFVKANDGVRITSSNIRMFD